MRKLLIWLSSVCLSICAILRVYIVTGGLNLAFLTLFVCTIISIFIIKHIDKDNLSFSLGVLLLFFINIVFHLNEYWFDSILFIHNIIIVFLFFLILCFLTPIINPRYFIKTALLFGVASSIICIYQRVSFIITGTFYKNFYLPFFDLNRKIEDLSQTRPSVFFSEPAHLAIFLLPLFYYTLKEKKIYLSILFYFGLIFSGSTTSFIMVHLLLIYFLYEQKIKFKYLSILLTIFIVLSVIIISYFPDILFLNIQKIANTNPEENIRILGGLNIVEGFSFKHIIFGIGFNQLSTYSFLKEGISLTNYSNAILFMFLSFGLLGSLLLLWYIVRLYRKSYITKGYILILICILFSDQILFNMNFLYLLSFVQLSTKLHSKKML